MLSSSTASSSTASLNYVAPTIAASHHELPQAIAPAKFSVPASIRADDEKSNQLDDEPEIIRIVDKRIKRKKVCYQVERAGSKKLVWMTRDSLPVV